MSSFNICEYCDEIAKRLCRCSSTPQFCCDEHTLVHMNSKEGAHHLEDALEALSEKEIIFLKTAIQLYQRESIQQAISTRNSIVNSLVESIKKAETECSLKIESALNGEAKRIVEELSYRKSIPLFSGSSFLANLVSLKKSKTFFVSKIVKEFEYFSEFTETDIEALSLKENPFFLPRPSPPSKPPVQADSIPDPRPRTNSLMPSQFQLPQSFKFPIQTDSDLYKPSRTFSLLSPSFQSNFSPNRSMNHFPQSYFQNELEITTEVNSIPQWELYTKIDAHQGPECHITSLAISDCNQFFASASKDKTIKIWESKTCNLIRILKGHKDGVTSVVFLGEKIVSGSLDKTIKIWKNKKCAKTLKLHSDSVYSVCASSCKKRIASGSFDCKVILYSVEKNKKIHTFHSLSDYVTSVVFSQDDKEIMSGSVDGSIMVWNTETGELLKHLNGHRGAVYCVSCSNDLIVSSGDNSIKIWQRNREDSPVLSLQGHTGEVSSVDLCDNTVASLGADDCIKIWDASNGMELQVLEGHGTHDYWTVGCLKMLENGQCLLSAGWDGEIKIWRKLL